MRTTYASGRYVASEIDLTGGPVSAWAAAQSVKGVVYCEGSGITPASPMDSANTGRKSLVNSLGDSYPFTLCALGGDLYGNSTVVTRVGQAKTWVQGASSPCRAATGTVLMVGISMGFLSACNYLKANPTLVAAIVGITPAVDLNDIHANNRGGATAAINSAYGGSYVEATHGPTYNPANYAATLPAGVPIKLFYASDDTVAIPSTATTFAATAPNCTTENLGALGHTDAAVAAAVSGALAFLAEND